MQEPVSASIGHNLYIVEASPRAPPHLPTYAFWLLEVLLIYMYGGKAGSQHTCPQACSSQSHPVEEVPIIGAR